MRALIFLLAVSNLSILIQGHGLFSRFRNLIEDVGGRAIGIKYTDFPVTSVLQCASECLKRKMCKMFGQIRNKCGLMGAEFAFAYKRTCVETRLSVAVLPQVLAGACSDHNCTESQTCQPRRKAGYRCVVGVAFITFLTVYLTQ